MDFLEVFIIFFNRTRKSGDTVGQPLLWQISPSVSSLGTQLWLCNTTVLS